MTDFYGGDAAIRMRLGFDGLFQFLLILVMKEVKTKMKKNLSLFLCAALLFTAFPAFSPSVRAEGTLSYESGSGTAEDPYRIATAAQFESIFSDTANGAYHYLQVADIDLSVLGASHNPGTLQLSGSYRGETDPEKGITHRVIHWGNTSATTNYYGLFYNIAAAGVVENIGVTGSINNTNSSGYVGGLTGVNYGTIRNCYSAADVSGTNSVGGIAGNNFGHISDCHASGNITASSNYAGGIAGQCETRKVEGPDIQRCYATGTVSAKTYAGGIIGMVGTKANTAAYTFTIADCYFTGLISGGRSGGILGSAPNGAVDGDVTVVIKNCYSLNPALAKEKIYGYGVRTTDAYAGKKHMNVTNNYFFVCEGNGYIAGDSRGKGLALADLTGPELSASLVGFDSSVWGFLVPGGEESYKFPQLINNPHVVPITDANITNNIGKLSAPTVSSTETMADGRILVTVDDSAITAQNDTALSYTVQVKNQAGVTIGKATSRNSAEAQPNLVNITDIIRGVEGDYQISVKADNGYKNNGSDFGAEKNFTYTKESAGEQLATPVVSGYAYNPDTKAYSVSWSAVTGASSYLVTIGDKTVPATTNTLDITSHVLTDGDYMVTVKAVSADGKESSSSLPYRVSSYYGGGTGDAGDPYKIYTLRHLNNVKHHSDKVFLIMNDIDEPVTEPIPTFSGSLIGNNGMKTISLNIETTDVIAAGLIGELTGNAAIENLELTGSVTANGGTGTASVNFAGALAGHASNATGVTIKNCVNKATVTNNGTRKSGFYGTGGLVGYIKNTSVENCVNEGTVYAKVNANAGGIIGYSNDASGVITGCVNKGSVMSENGTIGGIVGGNYGLVRQSANLHAILAYEKSNVGGIAGTSVGQNITGISECYNAANVIGADRVGGISGSGAPGAKNITYTVENSFNTGNVYGTGENVGGIMGFFGHSSRAGNITIDSCYDAQKVSMNILGGIQSVTQVPTVTVTNSYYLKDNATDIAAFRGEAVDEATLAGLITNGKFAEADWTILPGYAYPQLKATPYTAKMQVVDTLVKISCGEHGTVTPSGDQFVKDGDTITLTITPETGYRIESVLYNGAEVPSGTTDETSIYETSPVTIHSAIEIIFAEIPPVIPVLKHSEHVFNMYETIELPARNEQGEVTGTLTITGPKGITFATLTNAAGYEIVEYGMLFSKTAAVPELNDGQSTKLKATAPRNILGQYGMAFYGAGIREGETYYTRAYCIYQKEGEEQPGIVYADTVSFTPAGRTAE